MLKALEITGFKSFADKTRFDFPSGITVIVGPNGSGKSNIVDAIKWVLGEQSAKSLRGKDMADVIFKGAGSAATGRKASNSAEATLIIENEKRLIDLDADEIRVTRRVFRSGEGEYLINGEGCRLKDIKNLFRGTGVGTDSYSLIEQGKVDRMLQAGAKERRAIFEEAAGISRFKAKKVDAQRRLARVEQNLLRLSDIVEEVGSRYRSVKAQASKAARYKEYSDRLKLLRTQTCQADWHRIAFELAAIAAEKIQIDQRLGKANALIEQAEHDVDQFESRLNATTDETTANEQKISTFRAQIATLQSNETHERQRSSELEKQKSALDRQVIENQSRIDELNAKLAESKTQLENAEIEFSDAKQQVAAIEQESDAGNQQLAALQQEVETSESGRVEKNSLVQSLTGSIQSEEGELKNLTQFLDKSQAKVRQYESEIEEVSTQLEQMQQQEQRISKEAESKDSALAAARKNLEESRNDFKKCTRALLALQSEYSGVIQRADVIEELEKKLDGVQSGVKQVLAIAAENSQTVFGEVHGLVADIVQVNVQHAPLVDLLLGNLSQHVVVSGDSLLEAVAFPQVELKGRTGFIRLDHLPAKSAAMRVDLKGMPGVIGRADQLVTFNDHYRQLIEQLLGNTWVVKSVADVIRLQAEESDQVRYVTLDGDLFETDGTLVVGPRSSSLGLVSRRSELRSLKRQISELEEKLQESQVEEKQLVAAIAKHEDESETLMSEQTALASALSEQRIASKSASERKSHLTRSLESTRQELDHTREKQDSLQSSLVEHQSGLSAAGQAIEALVALLTDRKQSIRGFQSDQKKRTDKLNQLNIEIARREQLVASLEESAQQIESSLNERTAAQQQFTDDLRRCDERFEASQRAILSATSELAEIYIRKDDAALVYRQIIEGRESLSSDLKQARETFRSEQSQIKTLEKRKHDIELSTSQFEHNRTTMHERMLDDYGVDLSLLPSPEPVKLADAASHQADADGQNLVEAQQAGQADAELDVELDRDAIEEEINNLRRKINNIGAVNTDALIELEDLEERYTSLDGQYQDLVDAKETLDKIIVRINADSRRLFAETLEAIRQNFQVLYRRTFGGGRADIVLEEGVDILDAGIEIIATPPGKPEFNNSLLSGGEKALTAVSLLLAIFQFRPSPFCVLDEVDAPFDEANIGRFVDVLRSFLGWTKFVIVTHSKKTMTAANTLHGVTMEESGVSTRVSVRFEDVTDDGHIRPSGGTSDDAA